jgi:competence protein ComEA
MHTWQRFAFGVCVGLAAAGLIILIATRPKGVPYTLHELATPSPIQVHVDGEVLNPGVYSLPRSARVADAVNAAGGLTAEATIAQINLAAPLLDGSKVYIPEDGELITSDRTSGFIEEVGENSIPSASNPLNINTATIEQLILLPGVGSTRAADIVYYRQVNGDFKNVEGIMDVPGIGETTYNQIKDLIKVNP